MSLLGKLAALFSGGATRNVCVVDGDRLAGGDRVGPGERFQALSKLARFASRENMSVTVVFGGRPLREAAEDSNYNGVVVRYGESPEEVRAKLLKALSSAGSARAALVTSDAEFEAEMASRGYGVMRVGTLRKAMEPVGSEGGSREGGGFNGNRDRGGDRGDRGDRDGGRGNRNRNRGRGGRRPQGDQPQGGNPPPADGSRPDEGSAPSAPAGNNNDPVKNLIDLVE